MLSPSDPLLSQSSSPFVRRKASLHSRSRRCGSRGIFVRLSSARRSIIQRSSARASFVHRSFTRCSGSRVGCNLRSNSQCSSVRRRFFVAVGLVVVSLFAVVRDGVALMTYVFLSVALVAVVVVVVMLDAIAFLTLFVVAVCGLPCCSLVEVVSVS